MTERFAKGQGLNNSSPIKDFTKAERPSGQVTIVCGQGVHAALTNGDALAVTELRFGESCVLLLCYLASFLMSEL